VSLPLKSLLTNSKNQVEETLFHHTLSLDGKKNLPESTARPITPKEMNKITTVSFLHTVYNEALWTGVIFFYTNIKRKKELKRTFF